MKKLLIGLGITAAVGSGAYYYSQHKASSMIEQRFSHAVKTYTDKPYVFTSLQSQEVETLQWQVLSRTDSLIRSELTLKLDQREDAIVIPLVTTVTRGEVEHDGISYGFGKLVTQIDSDKFAGLELPESITPETFTSTQYIGLDGSAFSVDKVLPIVDEELSFDGFTAQTAFSLIDRGVFSTAMSLGGIRVADEDVTFSSEPMKLVFSVDSDGKYVGTNTPINLNVTGPYQSFVLETSDGDHSGTYKYVDGLNMVLSNGTSNVNKVSLTVDGSPIHLENVVVEGGLYEASDNAASLKLATSADIDGVLLKQSASLKNANLDVTFEHVDFGYEITDINYAILNSYQEKAAEIMEEDSLESVFTEQEQQRLLGDMQKQNTKFLVNGSLVTAEGKASFNGNMSLNTIGRTGTLTEVKELLDSAEGVRALLDASVHAEVSQELADRLGVSMMLEMFLGIGATDNKYVIKGGIQDGVTTLNGQVMP